MLAFGPTAARFAVVADALHAVFPVVQFGEANKSNKAMGQVVSAQRNSGHCRPEILTGQTPHLPPLAVYKYPQCQEAIDAG
jgi:hypothetical protein